MNQQNPTILIPYADNLVCCLGVSLLESVYAPYFSSIHSKPYVVRTTYALMGVFNILGKFVTGFFLDLSKKSPIICSLVGNTLMFLPYLSLATIPYWHVEDYNKQWVVLGGSPMLSCGFVMIYTSTFLRMYQIKLKDVNGQDTSALISGNENTVHLLFKLYFTLRSLKHYRTVEFFRLFGNIFGANYWRNVD